MNINDNKNPKPATGTAVAPAGTTKPTVAAKGAMAVAPKNVQRKECEIITRLKNKEGADSLFNIIMQLTGGDKLFVEKFVECCKQQVNKHWKRNEKGQWVNPFLVIPLNSQLEALYKCASKKILPDGYNCNLVPYLGRDEKKVEVSIDFKGLIDCAIRDGIIKDCDAMEVCINDEFEWSLGEVTKWSFDPRNDRGGICGYIAWAVLPDGRKKWKYMSLQEIDEVRLCAKTQLIWKKWPGEMSKKTVIRRLFKTLRNTPNLQNLMSLDNEEFIEMEEQDGAYRQKKSNTPVRRVVGAAPAALPAPDAASPAPSADAPEAASSASVDEPEPEPIPAEPEPEGQPPQEEMSWN